MILEKNEVTKNSGGVPSDGKVSIFEKFAYGMGDFWTSIVYQAMATYLVIYYTDIVGISAAAVGTIMLVVRFIDAVYDLGVGAVVDRTKTKYGKARPWLLWMGIPFGLCLTLLFIDPGLGTKGTIIYAFTTYVLLNMVYSAVNIPYGALNALMTQDSYQRTLLNIFRMTSAYVGAIVINAIAMPSINSFSNPKIGWAITFGAVGLLIPIGYFFTFKFTKERVQAAVAHDNSKINLKREVNALVKNKYWIIMVFSSLVYWVISGITSGLNAYVAKYILNNSNIVGVLGIASMVPLIIGVPLMGPVLKKFGKRNTSLIGVILMIPASLIMLIDYTNPYIICAGVIIRALAIVPLVASLNPMLTDVIDYGEWKFGIRSEGLVFSASSFGMKVGAGLASAIVGFILAFSNYDGMSKVQSVFTLSAIANTYIWLPLILAVAQFVLLYVYTLDKKQPEIVAELQLLRRENN